ncbi:methylglutaconyl-CoA hydratase [Flavobacteriales bacterium]|nr:Short-chain-enoyl-CoA hydratase [Flavobacteriales bacterium]MCL4815396.1 enoyl-CoA hydratase/isomerase family protein [Flavobacteriales bacterium]WKZ75015.1 MAG: enoyl-CoA hydratase/isomerase family protein [Vicingaceae bacterium]GIK69957.1 MAG: enoyl-CoA hydratase [Bacteroidota bacterium]CAG0959754.1 methylglutaconyl-CoA hydratase [Flavobacteriales bacterium]
MTEEIKDAGKIKSEIKEGVATIEFSHPLSNSMPGKLLTQLAHTITQMSSENSVVVIILKSAGEKAFCAGASFDELLSINNIEEAKLFFSGFANVINAARECPKFILGRVQGKAVGGGVGLAASSDYCVATTAASVKLSELAVGIGPFVVGPVIERKIGLSAMSQLAMNATEWYSAQWAKEKGLFAEVFNSIEEMDKAIFKLAHTLAKSNPEAMKEMKKTFWQGTEHWNKLLTQRAAISGKLVLSDFSVKAISAFKKK